MRVWPALDVRLEHPAAGDDERWELLQAALTDFDLAAIDDNTPGVWRVFFHGADARDRAARDLGIRYPTFLFHATEVPDEDWAARSQANLKAVRVGGIIVAPPWDIGRAEGLPHTPSSVAQGFSPAITIVIQPSMGFGTGHHATTRLCLDHLQQLDLRGRSAIDVGTGSGVLAIAASRLGATHVLAVDDDPDAIQSARENLDLNPGIEVTLGALDIRSARLRPFDVVLANLTGALLASAAVTLQGLAAPGGRLVLSGFLDAEQTQVLEAFASATIERQTGEDHWVCVTLRRSP